MIRFQYFTWNDKIPWTDLTFSESLYNVLFRQTQKGGCSHALAVLHPSKVGNYFVWNNILFPIKGHNYSHIPIAVKNLGRFGPGSFWPGWFRPILGVSPFGPESLGPISIGIEAI